MLDLQSYDICWMEVDPLDVCVCVCRLHKGGLAKSLGCNNHFKLSTLSCQPWDFWSCFWCINITISMPISLSIPISRHRLLQWLWMEELEWRVGMIFTRWSQSTQTNALDSLNPFSRVMIQQALVCCCLLPWWFDILCVCMAVDALIRQEIASGTSPERIIVGGFSQGMRESFISCCWHMIIIIIALLMREMHRCCCCYVHCLSNGCQTWRCHCSLWISSRLQQVRKGLHTHILIISLMYTLYAHRYTFTHLRIHPHMLTIGMESLGVVGFHWSICPRFVHDCAFVDDS